MQRIKDNLPEEGNERITEQKLRKYLEPLVRNLKNIHDPNNFHPAMRFRDGPKMIIQVYDNQDKKVVIHFSYLENFNVIYPFPFNGKKLSDITAEDVEECLTDEAVEDMASIVFQEFNSI